MSRHSSGRVAMIAKAPVSNKFEDCRGCVYRRRPDICRQCDFGEFFEEREVEELRFDDAAIIQRGTQSMTTIDDEPDVNPDELLNRLDHEEDESDEHE